MCLVRLPLVVNEALQTLQLNAFTPVCVFSWDLRTPEETKPRPQSLHLYGFSPVCDRTCCFRWLDFLKPLLQ